MRACVVFAGLARDRTLPLGGIVVARVLRGRGPPPVRGGWGSRTRCGQPDPDPPSAPLLGDYPEMDLLMLLRQPPRRQALGRILPPSPS